MYKRQDPKYLKAVATVKHFAVHSGPEKLRHELDVQVSLKDMKETYLPAFKACVKAGAYSCLLYTSPSAAAPNAARR